MRDETYILNLCDTVLDKKALRQYNKFPFLLGDLTKRGRRIRLPVDGYYEELRLVVEYHERQHCEPVPFFDRRIVSSGITRGEQRRKYDLRRMEMLPENGITFVVICYKEFELDSSKRLRQVSSDLDVVRLRLQSFSVCKTQNDPPSISGH
jgi:hypothetical protein